MSLDAVYSFISREGNSYDVIFSPLKAEVIPNGLPLPIVDVLISIDNHNSINSIYTLIKIVEIIKDYLDGNDVVLYSYCDNKEILTRHNRKKQFAPQEYRSQLFSTMFAKYNTLKYLNEVIVIEDEQNGDHYIHLISHLKNAPVIEEMTRHLAVYGKD